MILDFRVEDMKRETLLRNLGIIVERINAEDLPVQVKEIYVFGSFIRGKEKPHDLDIVIISDWDQAKKKRWEEFRENFMRFIREHQIGFVGGKLEQYRRTAFEKLATGELEEKLKAYGVDPSWASCYSWTELVNSTWKALSCRKILRKKLLKGIKGVQVIMRPELSKHDFFLRAKNFRLAWSIEKPNIKENLKMTKDEEIEFLRRECEHLREEARSYREEKRVLEELYYNANKDIAKEELARLVLMEIPKYEIKEKRIREILRQYGLPEERIGRWGNDYFIKE
jgi:hypothetical protein